MAYIFYHIWQLILLLFLLLGPVPLSIALIQLQANESSQTKLSHIILTFLTYWCVFIVAIGVLAGIVGRFFLVPILFAELVLFSLGLWLLGHSAKSDSHHFPSIIFPRLSIAELFIIAATSFTGAVLLKRLLTLPIINYDSLWYHLPIMARWYQEGAFVQVPEFMSTGLWTTDQIIYYPFNWEILCTLFIMPFKEDFLVALPNLLVWLMLGLAIYRLGDLIGVSRVYNLAAISLVLSIPLILQHINSLHIDLPFTAFFLISFYFVLLYHKGRSPYDIMLFLMSFGMLLGIKMSAVGYGILPVFTLLILEAKSLYKHREFPRLFNAPPQTTFLTLLPGVLCCLLIGGFWYIRNWVQVGNPLGDVEATFLGITFPGTYSLTELRQTNLASLFAFTDPVHIKILLTQAVVRLQLPFLALALQAILFPWLLFSKKRQLFIAPFLLTVFLLLATTYLYWTTPMTATNLIPPGPISPYIGQQLRFAIPVMALLGVIAAAIATILRTPLVLVIPIVLASNLFGTLSNSAFDILRTEVVFKGRGFWTSEILDDFRTNPVQALAQFTDLLQGNLLVIVGYAVLFILIVASVIWIALKHFDLSRYVSAIIESPQQKSRFLITTLLVSLFIISTAVARYQRDLARHEIFQGIYSFIDTSLNKDEGIGHLFSHRTYPLYGKYLDRRVVFTPNRFNAVDEWVNDLRQKNVSVVAIGPLEEQMGWQDYPEVDWLQNNTQYFERVFGQDPEKGLILYRLKAS